MTIHLDDEAIIEKPFTARKLTSLSDLSSHFAEASREITKFDLLLPQNNFILGEIK